MWESMVIGFAAIVQSSPAAPAQVDWRWQAEGEGCVLRQQLEDGGSHFEIARTPGNDLTRLTLVDRRGTPRDWKPIKAVTISLDPTGGGQADGFVGPGESPNSRAISLFMTNGSLLGQLAEASALTMSNAKVGTIRITPRSTGAAMNALTECEDRKMRKWGVDPVVWRALPVKPIPETPLGTWVTWYDYPDREKNYRNDITVVARLDLGADGSVQGCEIVNQPPAEFREAACTALKRNARLQPARDAMGRDVAAPFVLQIHFGAFRI